jgi:hypothetical protein
MQITEQDFTVGEPQVAGPLAVFPVFGPEPRLEYRALAEAIELGAFVKELDAGASVGELDVHNPTDLPFLIYEGEEVLGAQQNRTFDTSVLIDAGRRALLNVSCVEQGRWDSSRHGEALRPSPQAADPSLRRTKRQTANVRAAAGESVRADQMQVWHEVGARLAEHGMASTTAALSDVYDGHRDELAKVVSRVSHVDGQVGAVAMASGRPIALDLVSRPNVFAALLPRLAQGYALDALANAGADPDPEVAEAFVRTALESPRTRHPTAGMGRAFGIESADIVGSGLKVDDELVQLCAFPHRTARAAARIARPSRRRRRAG